ncbi:MAG TPA: Fic family protein [Candidatus Onthousia faecipullorum]|mgnify:FL=1|uniref:Fic family protein n=1 Tax=Candidatus Onthousia faecipullorum TaxID=2840887 RepID=A0A9D1GBK5_9FIRM|nr:Fic family protein [Candidatus Onthousia faecipullorum]
MMNEEIKTVSSKYSFASFLATYYVELLNIHPFREGNGRTIREFIREYAIAKSKELPIGEFNFSWANVDKDAINEVIDKGRAFRSVIELEFMKALEPVFLDKSL